MLRWVLILLWIAMAVAALAKEFDTVYGRYVKRLARLEFLTDDGNRVVLSDRGAFRLHAFEDLFSINYVGRLWGDLKHDPWPQKVTL